MELGIHSMSELFDQLGLPSSDSAIDAFIAKHQQKKLTVAIEHLDVWSPAQATFLKESRCDDADWAEIVDELAARLSGS